MIAYCLLCFFLASSDYIKKWQLKERLFAILNSSDRLRSFVSLQVLTISKSGCHSGLSDRVGGFYALYFLCRSLLHDIGSSVRLCQWSYVRRGHSLPSEICRHRFTNFWNIVMYTEYICLTKFGKGISLGGTVGLQGLSEPAIMYKFRKNNW